MQINISDKQLKSILHSAEKMGSHRDSDVLYGTRMFLKKLSKYKIDLAAVIQEAVKPKEVLLPENTQPNSTHIEPITAVISYPEPRMLESFIETWRLLDHDRQCRYIFELSKLATSENTQHILDGFLDYLYYGRPLSNRQLDVVFKFKTLVKFSYNKAFVNYK